MITMTKLTNQTYLEIYQVLNKLGEDYIDKLPKKLYYSIQDKASVAYTKNGNNTQITKEAMAFIALLHYNYWCNSEEEKEKLDSIFKQNEKNYQQELREKHCTDIFIKKDTSIIKRQKAENTELTVVREEKWHNKIVNFIKNIFRKKEI